MQEVRRAPLRARLVRRFGFLAFALLIILALALIPAEAVLEMLEQIRGWGPWGPLALVGLYVVGTVLLIPGWFMTVAAGFLFGLGWGTVTASIGSVCGASAAFFVGRRFSRTDFLQRRIVRGRLATLDRAVSRQGLRYVILTRLSPAIPFNLLSYFFGMTGIRYRDYLLGSWIAMLPGTLIYVSIGATAESLTEATIEETGIAGQVLWIVGLVATGTLGVILAQLLRRGLGDEPGPTPDDDAPEEAEDGVPTAPPES